MRAYMGITATVLALLDASSLDDRSMMSGSEKIEPAAGGSDLVVRRE
jgi:hypothetical protein